MNDVTLYKRNAKNDIIVWRINELADGTLSIAHGLYAHKPVVEFIKPTMKKANELQSRVKAKRKEGYKSLEDLYDNAPSKLEDGENEYNYLYTYLPKYNTTDEGFVLPMLAKTLEDNKPFDKFGILMGQWKINGLRCIIGAEEVDNDIFNPIHFTYTSREGTRWNLEWMDEILYDKLNYQLISQMVDEGICLDGELYLPGYTVNEINSFVKNPNTPQHKQLQYWCYDIAMEGVSAKARYKHLTTYTYWGVKGFDSVEKHLNNKEQFLVLPSCEISNIIDARTFRDEYINLGFEGLILRNPTAEYAFGKRNSSMFKYKKKLDGLFSIVDVKKDKRGLPIFTLQNDINSEYFECTINLPQDKQRNLMVMGKLLVGKKGLVEYRERSGVKEVPFHAKLITIYV